MSAARLAAVLLASLASLAHAAPDIFVWPSSLQICTTSVVPASGPESGAARVTFNRNVHPVTVINRGDADLIVSAIPFALANDAVVEGVRSQANGGNFVVLRPRDVVEAPPEFAIVPEAAPNPFLALPVLEATTNCFDALGNPVPIAPGAACQINTRARPFIRLDKAIPGGGSGGGGSLGGVGPMQKAALRISSNDPGQPVAWVPIYIDLPNCRPGGVASPQPVSLQTARFHGIPKTKLSLFDKQKTQECSCEGQVKGCQRNEPGGSFGRKVVGGSTPLICGANEVCTECCATYLNWVCQQSLSQ